MEKIKTGDILIDDCKLFYRVLEVFKNSAVVECFPNKGDLAAEIMSFESMMHEGWQVVEFAKLKN